MRLRSKISFTAFVENKTINELFLNQIRKTYNALVQQGEII